MTETMTFIFPAVGSLAGVFLGGWIANRNNEKRRKADFIEKQLSEFYGPIVSLRAEIKAHSELRVKIQNVASSKWEELFSRVKTPEARDKLSQKRYPQFQAIIEYDNTKLREELIPAYQKMITLFRDKMWLAEPETREYFDDLVEFVDIWERSLRNTLPPEVLEDLDHDESNLAPFYEHLEMTLNKLRNELK
ncbi:MAG: hypothetical protein IH995_07355 [Proteobacteria bacterium]|nr:hypothetical protein [Pseudomonadota bacterium]